MKRRLVIIGNGMAATRLAETLVARGGDKFQIVIIGDEPWQAYNRIQLSPVLGGEKTLAQTRLLPEEWYHQHGVTVRNDESVLAVEITTLIAALSVVALALLPGVYPREVLADAALIQHSSSRLARTLRSGGV